MRHCQVWVVSFVVLENGETRVLIMVTRVRIGVKMAAMRIRERLWRIWRCAGEDALRGIVAAGRCRRNGSHKTKVTLTCDKNSKIFHCP